MTDLLREHTNEYVLELYNSGESYRFKVMYDNGKYTGLVVGVHDKIDVFVAPRESFKELCELAYRKIKELEQLEDGVIEQGIGWKVRAPELSGTVKVAITYSTDEEVKK